MVKAAVRVSSGVPPFLFPFGLSARRRAERFGRWGHPESPPEQADWGGVAGSGVRAGGAKTGSRSRSLGGPPRGGRGFGAAGFSPAGNASFALVGQKSKPQNGEQKETFRRPNVAVSQKLAFPRVIRKRAVPAGRAVGKAPGRAKATAVVGFRASPWRTPGGAVGFPASP